MKRFAALILLVGIIFNYTFAQKDPEGLKKDIRKSDEKIADPKKGEKIGTWEDRANLFIEVYNHDTKNAYVGFPQKGGINSAEIIIGKPKNASKDGKLEVWEYDNIKLYFENGELFKWVLINPVDKDALDKSYQALLKAIKIDEKSGGKYKNKQSTMDLEKLLRNQFTNKAINEINSEDFEAALKSLETTIELWNLPRSKDDTLLNVKAINYQIALCYQKMSETYIAKKDTVKALEILQKGYQKYPESVDLIFALTNFYLITIKDFNKAEAYLDKAIEKVPNNPSLYFAKGFWLSANEIETKLTKQLKDSKEKAEDSRKKAFQKRNEPVEAEKYTKLEKMYLSQADSIQKIVDSKFQNAETLYNKSITVDPKFKLGYQALGELYYNKSERRKLDLSFIQPTKDPGGKIYDATQNEVNDIMKKGLTYYEKASELDPKDMDLLTNLRSIYYRLKMTDKYNEVNDKINKK